MSEVLFIVCSNNHKCRKIAKVVLVPTFSLPVVDYFGHHDATEDHRNLGSENPHVTYAFECRSRDCKFAVKLKAENLIRLYEGYRHAGRTSCELSELAATLRR